MQTKSNEAVDKSEKEITAMKKMPKIRFTCIH